MLGNNFYDDVYYFHKFKRGPGGSDWWSSVNEYSVSLRWYRIVWALDKDGSHTKFWCLWKGLDSV